MDLKSFFDSIYDKLILRDLIGKVVPGLVFILSVAISLYDLSKIGHFVKSMNWVILIAIGGMAWLLAFALQYAGELLSILWTFPRNTASDRDMFFSKWAKFHSIASDSQKVHAERLNVIKEACGNGSISLVVGSIIIALGQWIRGVYQSIPMCMLLTMTILAGVALWRMHVIHVKRYGTFVDNVLGLNQKTSKFSESDVETDNNANSADAKSRAAD